MSIQLPESFTNNAPVLRYQRLPLVGKERVTISGTSELYLSDFGNSSGNTQNTVYLGSPKTPASSFTIPTDYFLSQMFRLNLIGVQRATLVGNADLILSDDFGTRGRIVLAGFGG